jgi:hypothetical protein
VRERVVQMATKIIIEPIFEADFEESSYGFRPKRGATEALARAVPAQGQVVTDDPLVPFLAGRPVPGALIDTSMVRIRSAGLTARSLDDALSQPGVRAVVLWRGTFREMVPGLVARAETLFPVVVASDGDRRVLVRRPEGGAGSGASAAAGR